MKEITVLLLVMSCLACGPEATKNTETAVPKIQTASERLDFLTAKAASDLDKIPFDSLKIPRSVEPDGTIVGKPSKSWTSGFYPGMLWQLYGHSKNEKIKEAAMIWSSFVEKEKYDGGTHDLGFKIYCPFGNAYKFTGNEKYKDVFLTASKTLITRYSEKVGAIRSWDHNADKWDYPVIIDNMMNLEMLFEATKYSGDSTFYKVARQHAFTTLKNHFRSDHSSYHVVSYDPNTGEVQKKNTHQGFSHESAWSRGQAWGLYGYATTYRYTRDPEFLQQAKKIANYIFTHPNLPDDYIPYWDYDAPNIPNEPRDVSAATVTASGLLELSKHDPANAQKYIAWADKILTSLQLPKYQSEHPPFFLKHSVGSIPGKFEMDAPIIYAEYYYVEALMRRAKL